MERGAARPAGRPETGPEKGPRRPSPRTVPRYLRRVVRARLHAYRPQRLLPPPLSTPTLDHASDPGGGSPGHRPPPHDDRRRAQGDPWPGAPEARNAAGPPGSTTRTAPLHQAGGAGPRSRYSRTRPGLYPDSTTSGYVRRRTRSEESDQRQPEHAVRIRAAKEPGGRSALPGTAEREDTTPPHPGWAPQDARRFDSTARHPPHETPRTAPAQEPSPPHTANNPQRGQNRCTTPHPTTTEPGRHMTRPPHHRLIPTNVAALAAGVTEATIRKWVSRGKITRYGPPGRSQFDIEELANITPHHRPSVSKSG